MRYRLEGRQDDAGVGGLSRPTAAWPGALCEKISYRMMSASGSLRGISPPSPAVRRLLFGQIRIRLFPFGQIVPMLPRVVEEVLDNVNRTQRTAL